MQLEPGPIDFGASPQLAAGPPGQSLEALATEEAEWIEGYLQEADADLYEAFTHADQDWPGFLDDSFMEAAAGISEAIAWNPDPTIEGATDAEPEVDAAIVDAYHETPAEAWQEVPAPFVPPPDASQFTPIDDGGGYPPGYVPASAAPVSG